MALLLGEKIRNLRMSCKITQTELARHIGVTSSMVSAYENDIRQPSFESLLKIANYFKVSLDFLFDVGGSEYIDVSGLLTSQKTIVYEIVKSYREKNTKELLAAINENTRQGRADFS